MTSSNSESGSPSKKAPTPRSYASKVRKYLAGVTNAPRDMIKIETLPLATTFHPPPNTMVIRIYGPPGLDIPKPHASINAAWSPHATVRCVEEITWKSVLPPPCPPPTPSIGTASLAQQPCAPVEPVPPTEEVDIGPLLNDDISSSGESPPITPIAATCPLGSGPVLQSAGGPDFQTDVQAIRSLSCQLHEEIDVNQGFPFCCSCSDLRAEEEELKATLRRLEKVKLEQNEDRRALLALKRFLAKHHTSFLEMIYTTEYLQQQIQQLQKKMKLLQCMYNSMQTRLRQEQQRTTGQHLAQKRLLVARGRLAQARKKIAMWKKKCTQMQAAHQHLPIWKGCFVGPAYTHVALNLQAMGVSANKSADVFKMVATEVLKLVGLPNCKIPHLPGAAVFKPSCRKDMASQHPTTCWLCEPYPGGTEAVRTEGCS